MKNLFLVLKDATCTIIEGRLCYKWLKGAWVQKKDALPVGRNVRTISLKTRSGSKKETEKLNLPDRGNSLTEGK